MRETLELSLLLRQLETVSDVGHSSDLSVKLTWLKRED